MNKLAIFYHVRLNGSRANIDQSKAIGVMQEQIQAMADSELLDYVDEFHVGSNGTDAESVPARLIAGPEAIFTAHGDDSNDGFVGELPTLGLLQDWMPSHQDWRVLYLHTKGVTKPDDPFRRAWRNCMMKVVVRNWKLCIYYLEGGMDMVGAHWLTNAKYPQKIGMGMPTPIWAGNFWWANVSYLMTLPPLIRKPIPGLDGMVAENWVGFSKATPRVVDLAPHWPTFEACQQQVNL